MVGLQFALLALMAGGGQVELLDFYSDSCGPCRQMDPVVRQLAEAGYPVRKVNVTHERELARQFRIGPIPCFVMTVDGREVERHVGATSRQTLEAMFRKANAGRGGDAAAIAPSLTRPARAPGMQQPRLIPSTESATPLSVAEAAPRSASPSRDPFAARSSEPRSNEPLIDSRRGGPADENSFSSRDSAPTGEQPAISDALVARLMAASVRLTIEDPNGRSFGSGTVVDAREGEALILSCGHVFRDSKGQLPVRVDFFGPGMPQGLEGEVLHYDDKCDVGLVTIRTTHKLTAVPVAPASYRVQPGDAVVNIGCNNGNPPSARRSRVTSLNKFLGPANLQVAGQPVTGRSGGGLFSRDGYLIGVCNAADPTDNEGLYAALPAIYGELDKADVAFVYNGSNTAVATAAQDTPPAAPSRPARTTGPLDVASNARAANTEVRTIPPASRSRDAEIPTDLTDEEQAVLYQIRNQGPSAEVICIIRSLDDPRAESEIIVLDRASPNFLRQLAADREQQDSRKLTSHTQGKNAAAPARRPSDARRPGATAAAATTRR